MPSRIHGEGILSNRLSPRTDTIFIVASGTDGELRPGDWVQIKHPLEIAQTLDDEGMLDGLPFMPEMLELCGQNAQMGRRAEKTCVEYPGGAYRIREFWSNDTFVLQGLRCAGEGHDGCQRACVLFWKKSWFRKVDSQEAAAAQNFAGKEELRAKLKTKASPTRYVCQSTELARATKPLTRTRILVKCFYDLRSGESERYRDEQVGIDTRVAQGYEANSSKAPKGQTQTYASREAGIASGRMGEIKPESEVAKTLDNHGRNRGLIFDEGMGDHGKKTFASGNGWIA